MAARMRNVRVCFQCRNSLQYARSRIFGTLIARHSSDLVVNHGWQLDRKVAAAFDENPLLKHRLHPGIMRSKKNQLPPTLQAAINTMIEKYPTADLQTRSQKLAQYIWSRQRPVEDTELRHRSHHLEESVRSKYDDTKNQECKTADEVEQLENEIKQKVIKGLRKEVYHWTPIEYNAYKSFLYLVGRITQEYSTLYQIFAEIAKRNPDFIPETMFDFGSGVGSSIWAVNETWKHSVTEHYCVDSSGDMNTIARLLLQGGEEDNEMAVPGVYFRQFMPSSTKKMYNLVVSAFSLLELPNQTERLNTLYTLWKKTEDYLVLVENGTNAGFHSVLEARDFILQFGSNEQYSEEQRMELEGHVFSPCPHDNACGRYTRQDGTPCNFITSVKPLQQKSNVSDTTLQQFKYSYVVLKKGPRVKVDAWPRVVREPSNPSKRVQLRTCCPDGNLQVSVITASKHGKNLYWCARACKWGDLFPAFSSTKEAVDPIEVLPSTEEAVDPTNDAQNEKDEEPLSITYNDIQSIQT